MFSKVPIVFSGVSIDRIAIAIVLYFVFSDFFSLMKRVKITANSEDAEQLLSYLALFLIFYWIFAIYAVIRFLYDVYKASQEYNNP